MGEPHTHYNRSVSESTLLHERNDKKVGGCKDMRWRIKAGIEAHLTEDWLQRNVSGSDGDYLHHHESCSCEMGKIGEANKLAANKKRSDFYKTERGMEVKQRYKKRAEDKNFGHDMKTHHGNDTNKAELDKNCIQQLLARCL